MAESSGSPPPLSEAAIRRILSDERMLTLVTQPIVDLRRGVFVGYEILSRFALEGQVPPDLVFACATHCGLGVALEALVVRRALTLASEKPPNCFVSINVDPVHLTSPELLSVILERGDLGGIVFELTEQRELHDLEEVSHCLYQLRKHGAFIAVDDAGAGYAGLKQILALRPQFLKLDRALVSGVHADEAKRAAIEMLGELAERLDAWIIAEGVETDREVHSLAQLGVPLAQGFELGRPTLPWTRLTPTAERVLNTLPRDTLTTGLVEALVEPCTWCAHEAEWPDGESACVRLDDTMRPVELRFFDESGERLRSAPELLRVKRGSLLAAVALRGSARLERYRWDPIVCVDDLGQFEGLIHMHKLVWALASRDASTLQNSARAHAAAASALSRKAR